MRDGVAGVPFVTSPDVQLQAVADATIQARRDQMKAEPLPNTLENRRAVLWDIHGIRVSGGRVEAGSPQYKARAAGFVKSWAGIPSAGRPLNPARDAYIWL